MTRPPAVLVIAGLVGLILASNTRAENPNDLAMYSSPVLPTATVVNLFPKNIANDWARALDRPDADTKIAAAQSIALAHRMGAPGMDATIAPLIRELDRSGQHPTTRLAVATALVTLDAKQAADSLFRQLYSNDPPLCEVIEPALARWDYKPARTIWLERLEDEFPSRHRHMLAIRELGEVREEKAAPSLQKLAITGLMPQPVRLDAARALAKIRRSGLEADAARFLADSSPRAAFDRLIAASLLRQHNGEEAIRLLQGLARDSDPTVAAVALARLNEIDTKLIIPVLEPVLGSPDANVREFGVETLFRNPSERHITLLGDRLNDPHPDVRIKARVAVRELSMRPEFHGLVIREGVRILGGNDWRGQEQAAILLAQLDHKPVTKRLLELLHVQRGETIVAAAWALRKLDVPDTLPAVLEFVSSEHHRLLNAAKAGEHPRSRARDLQLSQLIQFIGQTRYKPAEPALREMIPRLIAGLPLRPPQTPLEAETRAAVMWALGLMHEGKPEPTLVDALEARIVDLPSPAGAEDDRVRRMAAISLGRMKATKAIPTLKRFYSEKLTLDQVNNACGWALEQITGDPLPKTGIIEKMDRQWFLSGSE